ncbi:MAG: hypothetical protein V1888_04280 [archaeon]
MAGKTLKDCLLDEGIKGKRFMDGCVSSSGVYTVLDFVVPTSMPGDHDYRLRVKYDKPNAEVGSDKWSLISFSNHLYDGRRD